MTARWTYSFSNLGPKKQISGTTFYKVAIGKETRWLSMEGVKMLAKAKEAGGSQNARPEAGEQLHRQRDEGPCDKDAREHHG